VYDSVPVDGLFAQERLLKQDLLALNPRDKTETREFTRPEQPTIKPGLHHCTEH
jgi:hypothetical protein